MSELPTVANAGRFEVRATAADHFAWVRTRLALERTMMAWQRTAVALIGFGFALSNISTTCSRSLALAPLIFQPHRNIWGSR
jgi:uncharacterized membrane protein YidH (DUF202 family)